MAANTRPLLHHYQQRFGQILVDEFQDTNTIQYAFIRVLAGDTGQVFVVGDDDQAIYGWRGAKVENVQRFLRDYPGAKTFKLEQNYRSTGNILAAANAVIAHNPERLGKQLWTADGDGEPIDLYAAYNEVDEARFVVERIRAYIDDGGSASAIARCCTAATRSRARSKKQLRPGAPALPRLRRPALLRAHGNQGRAGLPAPGRQPRRRRRLRARGQHAARAASANAPWMKCAGCARGTSLSLWQAAQRVSARHRAGRPRAQRAARRSPT